MKEIAATVPADFLCFISKKIMSDPVVAEDGETYERESIESYFAEKEKHSSPITSPATGRVMSKNLMTNNLLRRQITDFLALNPTALQSMYFRKSLHSLALKAISERSLDDLQRLIETDRRILDSTFEGNKKLLDLVCEQGISELLSLVLEELKKPCLPDQPSANANRWGKNLGALQPNPVPSSTLSPERLPDERKAQLLLMCYKNGNMKSEALLVLAKAFWSQDAARKAFVAQQISSGNVELVTALINGKVFEIEEELVEYQKSRALHLAVQSNKAEMVKTLIFLGADIHAKNQGGQTPKKMSEHTVFHADISRWYLEKTLEPLAAEIKKIKEENAQLKKDMKALETQFLLFVNKATAQLSKNMGDDANDAKSESQKTVDYECEEGVCNVADEDKFGEPVLNANRKLHSIELPIEEKIEEESEPLMRSSSASRNVPFFYAPVEWLKDVIHSSMNYLASSAVASEEVASKLEADNADNIDIFGIVEQKDNGEHADECFLRTPGSESSDRQDSSPGKLPGVNIPGWQGIPCRPLTNDPAIALSLDGNLMLARLVVGLWQRNASESEQKPVEIKYISGKDFDERRQLLLQRWQKIDSYLEGRDDSQDEDDQHIRGVMYKLRKDFRKERRLNTTQSMQEDVLVAFEDDTLELEILIPLDKDIFDTQYVEKYNRYYDTLSKFIQCLPENYYPQETSSVVLNRLAYLKSYEKYEKKVFSQYEADQHLDKYHSLIGWVQNRHPARWKTFGSDLPNFTHLADVIEEKLFTRNNTFWNSVVVVPAPEHINHHLAQYEQNHSSVQRISH